MKGSDFRKKLLTRFGCESIQKDSAVHDLTEILLQISLAVMLIFMIAVFLFIEKTDGKMEELRTEVKVAKTERLSEAVRRALDLYRIRYGLPEFLRIDPVTGEKSYRFEHLMESGKLTSDTGVLRSFKAGGANAWQDYSGHDRSVREWYGQVLKFASLGEHELTPEERAFLNERIKESRHTLFLEVKEVQTYAAASLQKYFSAHPEKMKDQEIRNLLKRLPNTKRLEDQKLLLKELSKRLHDYVFRELSAMAGVPMLEMLDSKDL